MTQFKLDHSTQSQVPKSARWPSMLVAGVLFLVVSGSFIVDSYLDQVNNANLSEPAQMADPNQYPA